MNVALGLFAGAATLSTVALMMGQGSSQPASDPNRPELNLSRSDYFVTGDANRASLWMRDGSSLRYISSADGTGMDRDKTNPETRTPTYKPNPNK